MADREEAGATARTHPPSPSVHSPSPAGTNFSRASHWSPGRGSDVGVLVYTESIGSHRRSYTASLQNPDLPSHTARNSGPLARGTGDHRPGPDMKTPPSGQTRIQPHRKKGAARPAPLRVDAGKTGQHPSPIVPVPSIVDYRERGFLIGHRDQFGPQASRGTRMNGEMATTARMPLPGRLEHVPVGVHRCQQPGQGSLNTGTPERARFTRVHGSEATAGHLRCVGVTEVSPANLARRRSTQGN